MKKGRANNGIAIFKRGMRKRGAVLFFLFCSIAPDFIIAQTTQNFQQQTGNYYASFLPGGAGSFNQNANQIGMWANGASPKRMVSWRKFRTDASGSNVSDRAMQVGDQFIVRLSACRAFGRMGFALLCSPATGSWDNRASNYAIQFNLDGPAYNGGNWGSWYAVFNAAAASAGSANIGGLQTTFKNFTFTLTLTAPDRMNATWTDGSTTSVLNDIQLNSSNPITDYSIFLEDDFDGGANRNVFWGLDNASLQHSLTNAGVLNHGQSNGSYSVGAVMFNGLNANSNSVNSLSNRLEKNGTGTLTLAANNTYQGSTTINSGILVASTLANGGTASNIGQSTAAAANWVIGNATFRYTGASVNTDRAFTISAATNATFDITTATTTLGISGSAASTSGALTKAGPGTLLLSGSNGFTGGVSITEGTLQTGNSGALNPANAMSMAAATTFSLNGNNITLSSVSGAGSITNGSAANSTLTINGTASTTFSGGISNGSTGTLGLTKSGTSTFSLSGTNTYSGLTTLTGGTLQINTPASLSANSNIVFNGGGLSIGAVGTAVNLSAGTFNLQSGSAVSLNLGTGTSTFNLTFANSSLVGWNLASTLTIFNWTPTAGKRIFVGAGGLTASQLARINFDNYGVGAKIVSGELRPAFLYVTNGTGAGNYSTSSSWLLGDRPTLLDGTESVFVQPGDNLVLDATVINPAVLRFQRVELGAGATVTMGNHTVTIASGGDFRTSGTVSMTASSVINLPAGSMTVGSATAAFGAAGTINLAGTFTFNCNSPNAVTLPNVNIVNGVDFGQNSTIAGGATLNIQAAGFVTGNAPIYASGATLAYNTGGTYNRGLEWSATSGRGYPHHVLVGTTTQLNLSNGATSVARQISGNLTINSTRVLSMQEGAGMTAPLTVLGNVQVDGAIWLGNGLGGDLRIGGNYTYGASGTVFNNNRAVIFIGSTDQFVTRNGGGSVFFDFLVVDKPNGDVKLTAGTNATIISAVNNDPNIRVLQLLRGNIDLNDGTLTLEGANAQSLTVLVSGTQRRIYTSTGTGDFRIQGSVLVGSAKFLVVSESAGQLLFDNNVTVSTNVGVNFGPSGITTINSIFRIDTDGFVITNSPDYGNNSTLVYNNGPGGYKRNMEWNTDNVGATGAGYPTNVVVQNNTPVELNSIDFPAPRALGCFGNLTIDAGSTLTANALASPFTGMAFPITVSGNLNISGTLVLSTNAAGVLNVGGNWSRTGTFTQNNRNVNFNGAADAILTASGGQTFSFMTLAKTGTARLTINDNVAITDSLGLLSGRLTLNNRGISIVSTDTKTARIGVSTMIPDDITYTGANGKFFVQRYVPARRSWRLVTAPFREAVGSSINTVWQEDQAADFSTVAAAAAAVAADTSAGFGTQITGGTLANGFDLGQFNNASLKFFSAGSWQNFNTNTRTTAANSREGWMLFVRGDRKNYGQITTANKPATITTLRPRGEINLGSKSITSTGLTVVGNPYASAVDFTTVQKSVGLTNTYIMWDPYLNGSSGTGAFVTLTWTGSSFTKSTPSNIDDRFIPSGAAVMYNFGTGGTLTFREVDKASSTTTTAFRPVSTPILRAVLHTVLNDSTQFINDGNIVLYDKGFNDGIDLDDAIKVNNFSENFSIRRQGVLLSVERKNMPFAYEYDTVFYSLRNMRLRNYRLALSMAHIEVKPGTAVYMEDDFLKRKMPIPLNDSTNYDFSVTTDSGSYAQNRFRLVFEPLLRFISLEAMHSGNDNLITWQVSRPLNSRYVIERSNDGTSFTALDSLLASDLPGSPLVFSHADRNPAPGVYYYRIRCVGPHGVTLYSDMVKLARLRNNPPVYLFPNPVSGNRIGLQMNNVPTGVYSIRLFDAAGRSVLSQTLQHRSATSTHWITPPFRLASGTYRMQLTGTTLSNYVLPVVVKGDD